MALKKKINSEKTGSAQEYHRVSSVNFSHDGTLIGVESYADEAARDGDKAPVETTSEVLPLEDVSDGSIFAWAYKKLKALDRYKKSSDV